MVRLALRSALSDRASRVEGRRRRRLGDRRAEDEGRGHSCSRRSACAPKGEREDRVLVVLFRTDENVVEVAAQPRRARADRAARRAEHVRRAAERLDRVLHSLRSRRTIARLERFEGGCVR